MKDGRLRGREAGEGCHSQYGYSALEGRARGCVARGKAFYAGGRGDGGSGDLLEGRISQKFTGLTGGGHKVSTGKERQLTIQQAKYGYLYYKYMLCHAKLAATSSLSQPSKFVINLLARYNNLNEPI